MDCQKFHQEIKDLEADYQKVESQYEDAERDGRGGVGLEDALQGLNRVADTLLGKYLPDFQEQFGDKLGIGEAIIEGEVGRLGNSIVSMPWGENFAVTREGLFSVVGDENGGLSCGELIAAGSYLGVFPMSDKRIMLPTQNKISVLEKKNDQYILCETLNAEKTGKISRVVAMPQHGWVIASTTKICMLDEDANGDFVFSEQIDLTDINPDWKYPTCFSPLSDDEILISNLFGGTGVFTKNNLGGLTYVKNIFEIPNSEMRFAGEAVPMAEDEWFIYNYNSQEEGYFLYRNDSMSQAYNLSIPISEMVDISICSLSHLSRNEFLIEDDYGNIFIYAMQPDGCLKRKNRIAEGDEFQDTVPNIGSVIQLTDDVWLVGKNSHGGNSILRRRANGEYKLGEKLEGLDYCVKGAIPISKGRYLLSDDGDRSRRNEVFPMNHDLSILNLCHTFKDVEDLKSNLDEIIEVGNS